MFSLAELRALRATRAQIEHRVRIGELVSPTRGVFVHPGVPPSWEQRVAVACAAHPSGVTSHRSAGRLHGLRRLGPVDDVEITVPGTRSMARPDVAVHRSHLLRAHHVDHRPDGIRVTTLVRTVFDLAGVLGDAALESVIEQVIDDGRATVDSLVQIGHELARRGRPGSARFNRVLGARPAGRRPAESDLEVRVDRALSALGLPPALRRAAVVLPDGSVIHPDLWWPDLRLVVEIDHVTWHGGRRDAQYDKGRDRQLARLGVQSVRITDEDARRRLGGAAADIAAIAALRTPHTHPNPNPHPHPVLPAHLPPGPASSVRGPNLPDC